MLQNLFDLSQDMFIILEKGINIYDIEYMLLYQYDFWHPNHGDPFKETEHKITDISDGVFHFYLYKDKKRNFKYITDLYKPESLQGDYHFDGIDVPCLSANKLLRNYKINELKKQIKV